MARRLTTREQIAAVDAAAIAASREFYVLRFVGHQRDANGGAVLDVGRSAYDRTHFTADDYGSRELALAAARFARDEMGRDEYGRGALVYAAAPNGLAVQVPDR